MFKEPDFADNVFLTVFLMSVLLGLAAYSYNQPEADSSQLRLDGADVIGNSLYLEAGCFQMNMAVSDQQANNLELALSEEEAERPLTYQTASEIFQVSELELSHVEIHGIEENSYLADIVIENSGTDRIDVRPSDGLLIALEANSPVFIDEGLISEHGENLCLEDAEMI